MAAREQVCSCKELSCEDIPGSKIDEADLPKSKKSELKFWFDCRALKYRSGDTRAELISRVRKNLGRNLPLVDPDPGKCYTRAKKAKCVLCCIEDRPNTSETQQPAEEVAPPDDNWTSETSVLPKQFSFINIVEHARKSGRNAQSYVEKPLEKGYKFFFENYLFGVLCQLKNGKVHVKGKCYRSQRKSDRPHDVTVTLALSGEVNNAKCSCTAGANGYCNHTMGLLYLVDHVIRLKAPTFPKVGTCTENPQQWHKPRTQGIHPEPIMGYNVINPKYREKCSGGLKCTLYEARQPTVQNNEGASQLFDSLKEINPSLGFCAVFSEKPLTVQTKLNSYMVPSGSVLSYQLSLTESNFNVITNFPALPRPRTVNDSFPDLPIVNNVPVVGLQMPLTAEEDQFINNLKVPSPSTTEQETRGQSNNPLWFQIRRYRLTSSNFGLICKRKLNLSQTKFVQNTILTQKDLSNVSAVKYGLSNESKAAEQYAEYMKASGNPVQVSDCGVVISNAMPWLAASPKERL